MNNFIFSVLWYGAITGPANTTKSLAAFPTYFNIAGAPNPTPPESTIWARIGPATRLAAAWDKAN